MGGTRRWKRQGDYSRGTQLDSAQRRLCKLYSERGEGWIDWTVGGGCHKKCQRWAVFCVIFIKVAHFFCLFTL